MSECVCVFAFHLPTLSLWNFHFIQLYRSVQYWEIDIYCARSWHSILDLQFAFVCIQVNFNTVFYAGQEREKKTL